MSGTEKKHDQQNPHGGQTASPFGDTPYDDAERGDAAEERPTDQPTDQVPEGEDAASPFGDEPYDADEDKDAQ
ncbi:hypothetical protein [Zhihengliuella flava]|uniref:Uncharacterized protein n=1 Tax=Zhihengliuella flava TaxID=1285193 RepID=A0A931DB79_9MICC|nr:hypothetical protein [Zhihengliuella flava]MBG6085272.1 hypothetical protein [Zhihengliuella flava]